MGSNYDTLMGCMVAAPDPIPPDQEISVSPSWLVQNACLAFSLGVPYNGKPWANKSTVPQALPSLPLDSFLESPLGKEYSFSWRAAEEQGFSHPCHLIGDSEPFGSEAEAASWASHEGVFGKYFPPDRIGSEAEQSSSSNNGIDPAGGQMGLACPPLDDRAAEGVDEICSENNGGGEWQRVINLVQELTSKFSEPTIAGATGMENVEQNIDQSKRSDQIGVQPKAEGGASAQPCSDCSFKGPLCGVSADEIIQVLSAIQRKVEYIKDAVPIIAKQRGNFTVLVRRQCVAAAGAVKLISQLADAAAGIIPHIKRQVDADPFDSCHSTTGNDEKHEDSSVSVRRREDVGVSSELTMSIPTLAAVAVAAGVVPVRPVPSEFDGVAVNGSCLEAAGPSELVRDEKACASSLLADLLVISDSIAGADGFVAAPARSSPFQWERDLEKAMRAGSAPQLGSEQNLRAENADDAAASGATSLSDEEHNPGSMSGGAANDESDEGDTRGVDQLPLDSFTLMEVDDLEILTEQTHYCNVCSKGFKRDANLRMHMRSHGGKYKSSTALIRSERAPKIVQEMVGGKPTRYSCPYVGCNRNMKHQKFQALKTMLCLKNHYRRSHCAKTLKCSICKSKQFSVVADLKTHEKHCGSDKWACSCGTTFSRKEKLFGHVSLFEGHVPVDASVVAQAATAEVGTSAASLQVQLGSRDKANLTVPSEYMKIWDDW